MIYYDAFKKIIGWQTVYFFFGVSCLRKQVALFISFIDHFFASLEQNSRL